MAKAKTQALTKYDAELAKYAQQAVDTEKNVGGGNFISLKSGRMAYKGAEIPGNKMNCIVVDHILENDFYQDAYDPDNMNPPDCYALGRDEDELAPHENSVAPQSESCATCPQNEFGTGGVSGKGKACGNKRRLALVTEGDMEDVENAEIAYLRLPVTSVRAWAGYVRQLKDVLNKPPFAVVTEIEVVPDDKTQFKVQFNLVQEIDEAEAIGALLALREKVEKEIAFPYQVVAVEEVKPAPRARAVQRPAPVPRTTRTVAAAPTPRPAPVRRVARAAAPVEVEPQVPAPVSRSRVVVGARRVEQPAKY